MKPPKIEHPSKAGSPTAFNSPETPTGTGQTGSRQWTLDTLRILPIPFLVAKTIITKHHYLRSMPAGTQLCFGVFHGDYLAGAMTFGAGPFLAYQLVDNSSPTDCLTLTRLFLDDCLPPNSESAALGATLRSLKRNTSLRFIVTYADPALGHVGTVYQATNWAYTGRCQITPGYDLGDGTVHHSRSLAHAFGSHSVPFLRKNGLSIKVVMPAAKHRYLFFLDPSWQARLLVPVLPYPKRGLPA